MSSISSIVYSRLNDSSITGSVSNRIYPTDPERGTDWPFLVYTIKSSTPVIAMSGATGLTNYTVQVDVWSKSLAQSDTLTSAISARLHAYRGGGVQGSFLAEQGNEQLADEEEGDIYHAVQTFDVWVSVDASYSTPGNVTPDQLALNANTSVTLNACSHSLTLDCGGLKLDGATVGGAPDLSHYARTDTANTFSTDQTVNGKVNLSDNGSNRKGQLSYYDAGGAYRFGRSDNTNFLQAIVDPTQVAFRATNGNFYVCGNGSVIVTGAEDGSAATVDLNRRPSDNSTGVGGTVRCWTRTGPGRTHLELLTV